MEQELHDVQLELQLLEETEGITVQRNELMGVKWAGFRKRLG